MLRPSDHQPPLPIERFIVAPGEATDETVEVDVLFVGGGPAGLAGAIKLAQLAEDDGLEIAVLEKAERPGDHCLSGAVVNPSALKELLPDVAAGELPLRRPVERERFLFLTENRVIRLPVPPTMHNKGCYVASICEIVRFLAEQAEQLGVHLLTGYPADVLLVQDGVVKGVRTAATGLNRDGSQGESYNPPTEVRAKVTVLCEGARGPLTQAYLTANNIASDNPQTFALGVKELWRVKNPLTEVIHTMGWPVPRDTFGGGWMYPMADDLISLGLVVGLDSPRADLDAHALMQQMKAHPFIENLLSGGELLEWGAKIIPEGGYHSIPHRLGGDGILIAGDAAGFVNVASLKGIHYAMHSGMFAAQAAHEAIKANDHSCQMLQSYDKAIRDSAIADDLYTTRNMRPAFTRGFFTGGFLATLATITRGRFPAKRIAMPADADVRKDSNRTSRDRQEAVAHPNAQPAPSRSRLGEPISKLDANFKSGNLTRDDIPLHVIAPEEVPEELGKMYAALCPAGVYEWTDTGLVINAPNCIDCRATDVLGPRWTPREGGSGPRYQQM
jgi:electron-transferring-flavoprotein dehydrogenase